MGTYYLIALGAALIFAAAYLLADKFIKASDNKKSWILKGASLALVLLFSLRYLSGESAIEKTVGLNLFSPFGYEGQVVTVFALFCFWLTLAAYLLLATYPFFKNKISILTPLVKYFASLVYLVCFCSLNVQITALDGADPLKNGLTMQGVFYSLELGLSLALCFAIWWKNYKCKFNAKRLGKGVLLVAYMVVCTIPVLALQLLFGKGSPTIELEGLTVEHRLALYAAFILPAILIVCLRKFNYEQKRYALLYLSIATMMSFSLPYSFKIFISVTAWPLHLCNTAMFIVPICLMFKLDKVFYFTLFINVLGAFLAMAMPNVASGTGYLEYSSVRFWINHYCAFFMPIVIIMLKLYERPKIKLFGYSLAAFACYYALVLFLNALLTNWDSGIDFFFINSDFIADKLGQWALDLRDLTWSIKVKEGITMTIYPIYQSLYFLVYVALSFGMWFLYELLFQVEDVYTDVFARNRKIKVDQLALEVSMQGRKITEPFNMETTNKLILRDFTKQYATSDVYAVHKANLEIEGGQIFGFLGPNGAGKSTIIKSIVGIQGISSGSIEVCGYDVEKQPVGAKMQIGFVPDHYALYENLTGREYVNYIADLYNVSLEDRTARINEYVGRFNLQGSFDNPIKTYSHGMKQKITIMSALVHNPKLWILDEPLTGLDPESIFQVKEAMKKHAQEGNIVFFSSHIIDVVERICDRIAIIKKGHILCETSVKALEEQGLQLEKFYMDKIENGDENATAVSHAHVGHSLKEEGAND
jgi:ABC-2 type transport system ATP-binding protein